MEDPIELQRSIKQHVQETCYLISYKTQLILFLIVPPFGLLGSIKLIANMEIQLI